MNRTEKASLVEELHAKLEKAKFAAVADYKGLKVPVFQQLRRELKKNGSEIKVAKNTYLRFASENTNCAVLNAQYKGTTAIAISYNDPVISAKLLVEFAKKFPEFTIKIAMLDGRILSAEDLVSLSKLPSREVLMAKLLSTMQALPTNFVRVLAGVPLKLVYLLQALKDKKDPTDN